MARALAPCGTIPQKRSKALIVPSFTDVSRGIPAEVIEQIQYRSFYVSIAPRQIQVIKILSEQPGAMAVDIAKQCGRDVSNAVRTLQVCETRGWIRKELIGRYNHYWLSDALAEKMKGKKGGR
jgi:hypothetical protein